jgi:anti-anti-sigma factor
LSISRVLGKVVVAVDGPVDVESTHCLRPLIADLVEGQGNLDVEIDLRRAWLDAAGVRLLSDTADQSRRRGGVVAVRGAAPHIRDVLVERGLADAGGWDEADESIPERRVS